MPTRSSPPDWSSPAASARKHSAACRAGGKKAFRHFRELVSELLCVTIAHREASVWMPKPKAGRPTRSDLFGGHGPGDSLVRLNNDAYLRLIVSLFLEHDGTDRYLRASMCTYQHQFDPAGDERVFRYEYRRDCDAGDNRPMGHLHVRGDLRTDCLPAKGTLERVHFACGRPTIEGVIAVLADEFGVPTHAPESVWRPLLRETEQAFLRVAHPTTT